MTETEAMSTSIIVVGASGRMGKTISGLVEADPQFTLAGLVDSPERIGASCWCRLPSFR